jgi:hypothetical protein
MPETLELGVSFCPAEHILGMISIVHSWLVAVFRLVARLGFFTNGHERVHYSLSILIIRGV